MSALLLLNGLFAAASVAFAIVAAARPAVLSHSTRPGSGEHFYGRMYAIRGVPLGVAVGLLPVFLPGPASACVVLVGALVQFGDLVIGVPRREWTQVVGGGAAAVIHTLTAIAIL